MNRNKKPHGEENVDNVFNQGHVRGLKDMWYRVKGALLVKQIVERTRRRL